MAQDYVSRQKVLKKYGFKVKEKHEDISLYFIKPEEICSCIERIVLLVSMLKPGIEIILTLSPIPLSGYIGTRYASYLGADVKAKAVAMEGLDLFLKGSNYSFISDFPAYEMVRGLAPWCLFGNLSDNTDGRHPLPLVTESVTKFSCEHVFTSR